MRGEGREEGELEAKLGLPGGGFASNLCDRRGGEATGEEAVQEGAAKGEFGSAGGSEEKKVLRTRFLLAVGGGLGRRRPHRRQSRCQGIWGFSNLGFELALLFPALSSEMQLKRAMGQTK